MFWDKKKNDHGLPDLPMSSRPTIPMKRMPDIPEVHIEEDIHQLPSFPDSPISKGFSQTAIREAVSAEEQESAPIIKEQWEPMPLPQENMPIMPPKRMAENKPIYVRLDKFQAAKKTLDELRTMVTESEELLKKVRELKIREDQELSAWEKEMQLIRARINNVSADIFDRYQE